MRDYITNFHYETWYNIALSFWAQQRQHYSTPYLFQVATFFFNPEKECAMKKVFLHSTFFHGTFFHGVKKKVVKIRNEWGFREFRFSKKKKRKLYPSWPKPPSETSTPTLQHWFSVSESNGFLAMKVIHRIFRTPFLLEAMLPTLVFIALILYI